MPCGALCAVDGCKSSKRRDKHLTFFHLPVNEERSFFNIISLYSATYKGYKELQKSREKIKKSNKYLTLDIVSEIKSCINNDENDCHLRKPKRERYLVMEDFRSHGYNIESEIDKILHFNNFPCKSSIYLIISHDEYTDDHFSSEDSIRIHVPGECVDGIPATNVYSESGKSDDELVYKKLLQVVKEHESKKAKVRSSHGWNTDSLSYVTHKFGKLEECSADEIKVIYKPNPVENISTACGGSNKTSSSSCRSRYQEISKSPKEIKSKTNLYCRKLKPENIECKNSGQNVLLNSDQDKVMRISTRPNKATIIKIFYDEESQMHEVHNLEENFQCNVSNENVTKKDNKKDKREKKNCTEKREPKNNNNSKLPKKRSMNNVLCQCSKEFKGRNTNKINTNEIETNQIKNTHKKVGHSNSNIKLFASIRTSPNSSSCRPDFYEIKLYNPREKVTRSLHTTEKGQSNTLKPADNANSKCGCQNHIGNITKFAVQLNERQSNESIAGIFQDYDTCKKLLLEKITRKNCCSEAICQTDSFTLSKPEPLLCKCNEQLHKENCEIQSSIISTTSKRICKKEPAIPPKFFCQLPLPSKQPHPLNISERQGMPCMSTTKINKRACCVQEKSSVSELKLTCDPDVCKAMRRRKYKILSEQTEACSGFKVQLGQTPRMKQGMCLREIWEFIRHHPTCTEIPFELGIERPRKFYRKETIKIPEPAITLDDEEKLPPVDLKEIINAQKKKKHKCVLIEKEMSYEDTLNFNDKYYVDENDLKGSHFYKYKNVKCGCDGKNKDECLYPPPEPPPPPKPPIPSIAPIPALLRGFKITFIPKGCDISDN